MLWAPTSVAPLAAMLLAELMEADLATAKGEASERQKERSWAPARAAALAVALAQSLAELMEAERWMVVVMAPTRARKTAVNSEAARVPPMELHLV